MLNEKQEKAIISVLQARTISEGLAVAGVSRTCWYQWLSTPVFMDAYRQARSEVTENAMHLMGQSLIEATTTLRVLMTSESEPVRLRAAVAILDQYYKRQETAEIIERLGALERILLR